MRILVACEFSGIVREAFKKRGHDAWSCDLLPTETPGQHIQGDVLKTLNDGWDMMIAHPPCTHLACSGARWFKDKITEQAAAVEFVKALMEAPIPRVAIENPVGVLSTKIKKPSQIIQPFYFGDSVQKATCLWLKNLPPLEPTNMVDRGLIYVDPRGNKHGGVHTMRAKVAYSPLMLLPRNEERWKIRSRTFKGIAEAMASQWGENITKS
jgi:site-specific DNA-cytosine methylase